MAWSDLHMGNMSYYEQAAIFTQIVLTHLKSNLKRPDHSRQLIWCRNIKYIKYIITIYDIKIIFITFCYTFVNYDRGRLIVSDTNSKTLHVSFCLYMETVYFIVLFSFSQIAMYLLAAHVDVDCADFEDQLYEKSLLAEPRGWWILRMLNYSTNLCDLKKRFGDRPSTWSDRINNYFQVTFSVDFCILICESISGLEATEGCEQMIIRWFVNHQ